MGLWVVPQWHEHLKLATAEWHLSTFEDQASNQYTDLTDFSEVFGKVLITGLCFSVLESKWLHKENTSLDLSFF